jgi:hypothetical protein
LHLDKGPVDKLHPEFFVLEFPPNDKHDMFCYCTVGMSADRSDDNLIELFVYSAKADDLLTELLTVCASFHRNVLPLSLNHTVNIGQAWLADSKCDHGLISTPYLDGPDLALFEYNGSEISVIGLSQSQRRKEISKSKMGLNSWNNYLKTINLIT